MLHNFFKILAILLFSTLGLKAQSNFRAYTSVNEDYIDGERIINVDVKPIVKYPRPIDTRRYARLIYNIKVVYPIAQQAHYLLNQAEQTMMSMDSKKDQKDYIKNLEEQLKEEYTPVLKRMTYSQGRVLLKLIDRQTSHTSYSLVKELRGSFSAFFWQGVARLFGANLKMEYDAEGEDKEMERLIRLYELGLI